MAAPKGNNNAEKWTIKEASALFDKALEMVDNKEVYILQSGIKTEGYKYDFIGELIRDLKQEFKDKNIYRALINTYLIEKFPTLKEKYNELMGTLETNCFYNAKKGNINTAVGIVNLKSNHKWTDRVENENKNTHEVNISPIEWVKQK